MSDPVTPPVGPAGPTVPPPDAVLHALAVTLRGCGMLVVNPPFGFADEARPLLDSLAVTLADDEPARSRVGWLSPE